MNSAIKKIIESNPVALATCVNNKPHVIAVASVKVFKNNALVITDNFMKSSRQNILKNKKVSLAVWDKNWNGYRINGVAAYYNKGKWLNFVKAMKENKGYAAKGAIVVKFKEIIKLC